MAFIYLFIYLSLAVLGLRFWPSPVAASGGHSPSWCVDLSLSRPLLLRSTGSRRADSVAVAHGPSCSAARGIFPDQGSNPCPLHRQADSQPLRHQGSPLIAFKTLFSWVFVNSSIFTLQGLFLFMVPCSLVCFVNFFIVSRLFFLESHLWSLHCFQ